MNLFVYSDESVVFDFKHEDFFVFGGIIYLDKDSRDTATRKYIHVEKCIRGRNHYEKSSELKASIISNKDKGKIFRSLNNDYKFGVVVDLKSIHQNIFDNKKSKQRYLDYVFKIALKQAILNLSRKSIISIDKIDNIYIFVDEHTTATNGRYELRESIEQEFKYGTFNYTWQTFHEPILPCVKSVQLDYCNSKTKTLIRVADIVANNIYYKAKHNNLDFYKNEFFYIIKQP